MPFQPMNNKPWNPEDGQLLQSLREKAGFDALVFARNNTVSLAQLRELEEGGESSFYSPLIKRSTGVKLLRKLGYEFPPEETPATQPDERQGSTPLIESPEADLQNSAPATAGSITATYKPGAWLKAPVFWGFGLATLALLVVIGPVRQMAAPEPTSASPSVNASSPTAAAAPALTPATGAQNTTAEPATKTIIALPTSASLSVTETPAAITSPANSSPLSCDGVHKKTTTVFRQTEPLKPGNYVHFVAQANTSLCVLDQNNQLTTLKLPAGASKTVFGDAPFLVQSSDWQALKIFFQGRRVHAAKPGVEHLQLHSVAF